MRVVNERTEGAGDEIGDGLGLGGRYVGGSGSGRISLYLFGSRRSCRRGLRAARDKSSSRFTFSGCEQTLAQHWDILKVKNQPLASLEELVVVLRNLVSVRELHLLAGSVP